MLLTSRADGLRFLTQACNHGVAMDSRNLRNYIINPVCSLLSAGGLSAENILLGTAATESGMGRYLKQVKGPALSPWQVETRSADDIEHRYLPQFKPDLVPILQGLKLKNQNFLSTRNLLSLNILPPENLELYGNLYYSCAIARLLYLSKPEPLPDADDIWGMARYWKRHYNTRLGKGRPSQFVRAYKRYVVKGVR